MVSVKGSRVPRQTGTCECWGYFLTLQASFIMFLGACAEDIKLSVEFCETGTLNLSHLGDPLVQALPVM